MCAEKVEIPLIKFEGNASAPILRYDLPSPSSYEGRNYIELDVPEDYFIEEHIIVPPEFLQNNSTTETESSSSIDEYIEFLLKDFLVTNEEIIREYIQNISIEQLEQQIYYFTLTQNESTKKKISETISKAKTEIQQRSAALENVALKGKATASSCLKGNVKHKTAHLNDGLFGNSRSWIAVDVDAWAKIELTEPRVITKVVFGRDEKGGGSDRDPGNVDVYYSDDDITYTMASNQVKVIQGTETTYNGNLKAGQNAEYTFTPFMAKYIKLYKVNKNGCIDELEIYSPSTYGVAFEKIAGEMELKLMLFKYYIQLSLELERRIPFFYKTMGGNYKLRSIKCPDFKPRLIFIETYRLTSFPGDYGAGTAIKTLSLLPKEETEISIKTWKKTIASIKEASSILDSYTEDKADEFEDNVQKESSKTNKIDESVAYHLEASAKTTFGCSPPPGLGGPKIKTDSTIESGVKGSTNSSRESMSRNVMNATEKHAQKSSAKREVNIDTSYERTEDMGEEVVITRRIENLNASRTLNFTFRQMNQQYHSLLHLIDLKLAFYNGKPGSMEEFELSELAELAKKYFKDPIAGFKELKQYIIDEYTNVFDYKGEPQALIEEIFPDIIINSIASINSNTEVQETINEADINDWGDLLTSYLRIIPPKEINGKLIGKQEYIMQEADEENGQQKDVRYLDGIIISNKVLTMKTDGVIVEALLGQVDALDQFAVEARKEKIREEKYENNLKKAHYKKIMAGVNIINELITDKEYDKAITAYREIFGVQEGIKYLGETFNQRLEIEKKT
ncbi:MAG: discoidin domain-containing protein [Promethearchaeota archaeon]